MSGPPAVLMIDGEWLLPRRPSSGAWELAPAFDVGAVVDALLPAGEPVRRILCFRNWSDPWVSTARSVSAGLQTRLVELHHAPLPATHPRSFYEANPEGVAVAMRAAATEQLLADAAGRILIASDRHDSIGQIGGDRIVRLAVPALPPLWREVAA